MFGQVTPISLNRRGSRLVIDVVGPVSPDHLPAIAEASSDCTEALVNLSAAYGVTRDCLSNLASALPAGLPMAFCSVPPSVMSRLGEESLVRFGRLLED